MIDYKGYDIEMMFRGVRVSQGDNIIAKLKWKQAKNWQHEVDKIIASNEYFLQVQKDRLKQQFTSTLHNVWSII